MRRFYVPSGLHGGMLRELLSDLVLTPLEASKFLRVTERSVWRWLADDSAPYAVLVALWHESPRGHYNQQTDVGNHNNILRGLASAHEQAHARETARLAHALAIGEFGSANAPFYVGPPVGMPYTRTTPQAPPEFLEHAAPVDTTGVF